MKIVLASLIACAAAIPSLSVEKAPADDWRLIRFSEGAKPVWLSPESAADLTRQHVGFMDITEADPAAHYHKHNVTFPSRSEFKGRQEFDRIMAQADFDNFSDNLDHFASYPDRTYNTASGEDAALWVRDTAIEYGRPCGATVRLFEHSWRQPSVIARIEGTTRPDEFVLWGAHEDSVSFFGNAPGFDDDGSGSMTILEAFKATCASGVTFDRTIEFQWYAAEESGLLGSAAIASNYASNNVNVVSMLQHDMTCFNPSGQGHNELSVITDQTDAGLNSFMQNIIDEYTASHVQEVGSRCGYGCSDHASFTSAGFPASFTFEKPFGRHNNAIHTSGDTRDNCDMDWMWEFLKMGVGYLVEQA